MNQKTLRSLFSVQSSQARRYTSYVLLSQYNTTAAAFESYESEIEES